MGGFCFVIGLAAALAVGFNISIYLACWGRGLFARGFIREQGGFSPYGHVTPRQLLL